MFLDPIWYRKTIRVNLSHDPNLSILTLIDFGKKRNLENEADHL